MIINCFRPLILKMDDDIVIDFFQLLKKLSSYPSVDLNRKLFGLQHFELEVMRRGKWAVDSPNFAQRRNYPNFLSGLNSPLFLLQY